MGAAGGRPSNFNVPLQEKGEPAKDAVKEQQKGEPMESEVVPDEAPTRMQKLRDLSTRYLMRGIDYDVHAVVEEDPLIAAIHANATKWDDDTVS